MYLLSSRLVFHMNLFLLWLLQHSIIAIFTCGLKDNLDHGVGNPARCRQRTEEWDCKGSDALLLHWTPGGQCSTFEGQICSLRKSFTRYPRYTPLLSPLCLGEYWHAVASLLFYTTYRRYT